MAQRIICHIDMNSYFASVEQQANPFLRGRAVGVCAYLHRFGCVIAASVEAKKLGMKVGMQMQEAEKIVPGAVFVQNDPSKYRATTSRVFAILHEYCQTIEHYSIDEAFMDLTGWCRDEAEAAFLFSRIKERIRTEVGEWLRCSVGIAPTRFLAKFASDREKPDGLVIVRPDRLDELFAHADLEDACGIGPNMRRRLEQLGLQTLLDVKRYPIENLMRALGKTGYYLSQKLNGIECENVIDKEAAPKSIGHSYCVPDRVNREKKVEAVLIKLTERVGRRLRAFGANAGALSVAVGLRHARETLSDMLRFPEPGDDVFLLIRAASRLLYRLWHGEAVTFLAVTCFDLQPPRQQLRFSSLPMPEDRERAVSRSLDRIRDRHGDTSIVFGRMFPLLGQDEAPDRIGFRKIGELEKFV